MKFVNRISSFFFYFSSTVHFKISQEYSLENKEHDEAVNFKQSKIMVIELP